MIRSRNFERRFATAAVASIVALLSFASVAQAIDRISVAPGFNGAVNVISEPDSNGTRYLGGTFTAFDAWGTGSGALVGASSGDVNLSFPKVNGSVLATAADGSGGFYIGGSFTCIGPNTSGLCDGSDDVVRNRAAHINADGSVDPSWNPNLNNNVFAIAVSGSNVYLGGSFTTVGVIARNRAAAVGTDGALTAWNPDLNNFVNAIAVSGSNVYLGGPFTTVGGTTRNRAAAVDATTGVATAWDPNLNNTVSAIGVSGSNVYLGGAFTTANGGAAARNRAAAVGTDGTLSTSWNPDLNNVVNAIAVSGSNVYLGGTFTTVGGTARNRAAAVDATTGTPTSWDPDLNNTVLAIGVSGSNVYLGGSFSTVGGITRNYSAAVGTNGTLLGPWPGPLVTDVLLSVTKSGSGSGTVASSPAGIDCGATCSTTFAAGTSVTLTATPAAGSSFTAWSGSGCSGTSTCTVVMSEARAVNAEFAVVPPGQFDLAVTKSGTGGGTVTSSPAGIDCGSDCSESLAAGTSVTLTATPASGSSFIGWSGSGCSGTSTCTVVMSEARAVSAEFAVVPPGSFNLLVSKSGTGGGTVTSSPAGIDCGSDCSETLADGTSVTLTATPAAGSSFTAWSGSGCSGTSTCTVVMSEARAVTAQFTKKPSNLFPTPKVKAGASALSSSVRVPGPGTLTQRVTRSSTVAAVLTVCKTSGKATKAGWVKLTCKLSKATRAALRKRSLRVSVKTTFTPTGGLPASKTEVVTLKSQRPPPYTG